MEQTTYTSLIDEHDITNVLTQLKTYICSNSNCIGTSTTLTGCPGGTVVRALDF